MKTRRHASRLPGPLALLLTTLAVSCAPMPSSRGNHLPTQLRGQIVSAASGEPVACAQPLVVMAIPTHQMPAQASVTPVVRRVEDAFEPSFIVVPARHTIRIVNDDGICHGFFSSSPNNPFDLKLLKPGESGTVRFEHPGLVQVYCSLHSGKQATILVAPTAYFAVVGESGEFEIDNFEPGQYVLEAWTEQRAVRRVEVTVLPRRTKFVEIPVDVLQLQASR